MEKKKQLEQVIKSIGIDSLANNSDANIASKNLERISGGSGTSGCHNKGGNHDRQHSKWEVGPIEHTKCTHPK